ncbi:hypothetical protein O206_14020 [Ochrobactrum sp. EGD-AQ16]|nr:hypothetical protein O206_14020 [Ochrobactrum sp. EGD-AQ16]
MRVFACEALAKDGGHVDQRKQGTVEHSRSLPDLRAVYCLAKQPFRQSGRPGQ